MQSDRNKKTNYLKASNALRFYILVFFVFGSGWLFGQSFQTYRQFGGEGNDKIAEIEVLPDGSFIASGTFTESITIGIDEFESLGDEDLWIARFDENLEVIWSVTGGSARQDEINDLKVAPDGSIIWVGSFWTKGVFGNLTLAPSLSNKSAFILKISESGEVLNAAVFSGTGAKKIGEAAIDSDENIFLIGDFSDTLFYSGSYFIADSDHNFFTAKLNSDFEMEWFRQPEGTGFSNGNSLALLPDGELIAAGEFIGSIVLENDTVKTGTPDEDVFFAKFSDEGEPLFLKRAGGVFPSFCKRAVTDNSGNFYIAGTHRGVIRADENLQIETTGLNDNFYLIAYREDGTAIWGRSLGSPGNDGLNDLKFEGGQLLATGFYEKDMEIDTKNLLVGEGVFNAFFAGFSSIDGSLNWIKETEGDEFQSGKSIELISEGSSDLSEKIVAGFDFSNEVKFGSDIFSTAGFFDFFVTKINVPQTVAAHEPVQNEFFVYPNPTSDFLFLETDSEEFKVEVYSCLGKKMYSFFNSKKINTSNLSNGVYYLKFLTEKGFSKGVKVVKNDFSN